MKKYINMRVETRLLDQIDILKKALRSTRTALIEQGLELVLQLYRQPLNKKEILKTAKKLINERRELYERLAKK